MAHRNDRPAAARASRNRRPGACPGWPATHRPAAAAFEDRPLVAVHPRDAGKVPDTDRQPAARHGLGTWLPRRQKPLPRHHRLPSATTEGGGLSAPAHVAGRAGPMRPGPFRSHNDRASAPPLDGLCPLMAFVMVLSFSRQIFLRFLLDARMENFLRGHLGAFATWNGIPRIVLYDNLRSAVLERHGDAIRFNPVLL